jgi:hypothetical protein
LRNGASSVFREFNDRKVFNDRLAEWRGYLEYVQVECCPKVRDCVMVEEACDVQMGAAPHGVEQEFVRDLVEQTFEVELQNPVILPATASA